MPPQDMLNRPEGNPCAIATLRRYSVLLDGFKLRISILYLLKLLQEANDDVPTLLQRHLLRRTCSRSTREWHILPS